MHIHLLQFHAVWRRQNANLRPAFGRFVVTLCRACCLGVFGVSLGLLAFSSASRAATVEITHLPAYGTDELLRGKVTGVDFATHRVAAYLHVEGSGWYTKPSFTGPTVPIDSAGNFAIDVVSGGLDSRARIYDLQVLPLGVTPQQANGAVTVPTNAGHVARTYAHRNPRTVQFAGRAWAVKDSPVPVGPGSNRFSVEEDDVFVDETGALHLTVRQRGGNYWSSEVILTESLGYGTYAFHTNYRADILDANVVFSGFTWDSFGDDPRIPAWPNREIDIEDSRWGNSSDAKNSQNVIQPHTVPGNLSRYTIPDLSDDMELTRVIKWSESAVEFITAGGHYAADEIPSDKIINKERFTRRIPSVGRETFRFNLWLSQPAPVGATPIKAVVTDFAFFAPGDFNQDGTVDNADLDVWRASLGTSNGGDADFDGDTDGADFMIWQRNVGRSTTTAAARRAVPEASAVRLVLGVTAWFWGTCREAIVGQVTSD